MPRDCDEGKQIRALIKRARRKVTLELEQGVYSIPAWVVPLEDASSAKAAGLTRQDGKE